MFGGLFYGGVFIGGGGVDEDEGDFGGGEFPGKFDESGEVFFAERATGAGDGDDDAFVFGEIAELVALQV